MCLTKKSKVPRIALKDKVVYKVIYKITEAFNDKYETFIQHSPVEINKTYKGVFTNNYYFCIKHKYRPNKYYLIKNKILAFIYSLFFTEDIYCGYIHSYTNYKIIENYDFIKMAVKVKCIIPKGTLYFIGKNNEITSRKLKYVEIL